MISSFYKEKHYRAYKSDWKNRSRTVFLQNGQSQVFWKRIGKNQSRGLPGICTHTHIYIYMCVYHHLLPLWFVGPSASCQIMWFLFYISLEWIKQSMWIAKVRVSDCSPSAHGMNCAAPSCDCSDTDPFWTALQEPWFRACWQENPTALTRGTVPNTCKRFLFYVRRRVWDFQHNQNTFQIIPTRWYPPGYKLLYNPH